MHIEVPLTLTIEVPHQEAASNYLEVDKDGKLTSTVNPEFIADLFDDGIPRMMIYDNADVLKVCGKTPEDIRKLLASRIP